MAYTPDESGSLEVYVRHFSDGGGSWRISTGGGSMPHWRKDGRELYFLNGGRLMAAVVHARSTAAFESGQPEVLFTVPRPSLDAGGVNAFGVSADGQRFLVNVADHGCQVSAGPGGACELDRRTGMSLARHAHRGDCRPPDGFRRTFYDVAPDGRFLMISPDSLPGPTPLTLLVNWRELLSRTR